MLSDETVLRIRSTSEGMAHAILAAHDAEVARKTLEDAAFDALLSSGRTFASREGLHDWLRARAASISTDKAGEGDCLNCEEPILPGQLKAHYVGRGDVHQNCPTDRKEG